MTEVFQIKPTVENPNTGIDDRKRLAANLSCILADTIFLQIKSQAYHWNVVGPLFYSIHKLTESQYENLFAAADVLAERIRALGYPAPTSVTEMAALTEILEDTENSTAEDMVQNLVRDHERVVLRLRTASELANELRDSVTADMLTSRMEFHEEAIWMLKSVITQ